MLGEIVICKDKLPKTFSQNPHHLTEAILSGASIFMADSSLHQVDKTTQYIFTFLSLGEPNILSTECNVYFVVIIFVFGVFLCFLGTGSFYYLSWHAVYLIHEYSQCRNHFKILGQKNPNISALCLLFFFKLWIDSYYLLVCIVMYFIPRQGALG